MYHYRCRCIRVIDGDTCDLDIDLGCHVHIRRIVRLLGINAPEIKGATREAGEKTKRRLVELIDQSDDQLCCKTTLDKNEKYGRLLATMFPHETATTSFNDVLENEGLAVRYVL